MGMIAAITPESKLQPIVPRYNVTDTDVYKRQILDCSAGYVCMY